MVFNMNNVTEMYKAKPNITSSVLLVLLIGYLFSLSGVYQFEICNTYIYVYMYICIYICIYVDVCKA